MNSISFEKVKTVIETNINHLSTHNNYIPFYTLFNSKVYKVDNKKVLLYGVPDFYNASSKYGHTFTSVKCITFLNTQIQVLLRYLFKNSDSITEGVSITIGKGYIQNDFNGFLCLLVVESDFINNIDIDNISPSKFKFLISRELIEQPRYKKLWNTIKNKYLPLLQEDNIDIVYTNNINSWAFKRKSIIPSFNNIEERDIYLNSINDVLEEISTVPTDTLYTVGTDTDYITAPLTQEEAENSDNNEDE